MKPHLFISVLLAGSMLAPPAFSQQRKSLFQVLFPQAHKERLERQRRYRNERRASQRTRLPKVKTSKNYVYKVPARSKIKLAPAAIVVAHADIGTENDSIENRKMNAPVVSPMTRDIVAAGDLKLSTEKHLASAISGFYKENQNYLWLNAEGDWNAKARSVNKLLQASDAEGLDPQDYAVAVSDLDETATDKERAADRVMREVAMTNAVLRYAMDASFGTINPNLLSGYHDFPVHNAKAADILDKIALKGLPANTLRGMSPSNASFEALKMELAALQGVEEEEPIVIAAGTFVRPGQTNPEIPNIVAAIGKKGTPKLLEKHAEAMDGYDGGEIYSDELVALVKDFQRESGLGADGIVGKNTIRKLTGVSSVRKVEKLKLAMERLRWHPHQLGERHVFINQPEYRARYIEGGEEKLSMRVVVGKKSNQTNFFYDEIEHIEYNPYWNVPRSIIVNEFLPKSLGNPGYLDQRGYEVINWGGKRMSSSAVNWYQMGSNPKFAVRQPPGPRNALGELKIMFPNKHSIYMHDTPAKNLFKRDTRAFSHGCVRLHDPRAMAAAVMGISKKQVGARVAQGQNMTEKLPSKVPVYVSYFTAWPQADGSVKYFTDMYGRDAHLMKAIKATRKARSISIGS